MSHLLISTLIFWSLLLNIASSLQMRIGSQDPAISSTWHIKHIVPYLAALSAALLPRKQQAQLPNSA